ncbi:hypothetical protein [Pseudorhodoferax sp.]|uniref:hypothetical protein n=1 Tax=Pseudorhodoferax sp. TaxID=1993553 RepID=UPI002DD6A694|nr:hypothetical protein [Pseudorhodoferax sp.]
MNSIISGLIGGLAAALVTSYVAKRVGRGLAPGQLRYGTFMWGLAIVCLAFAVLPIAIPLPAGLSEDLWTKVGLFLGFGSGAAYCFGEAAWVKGTFDHRSITFTTPWTGTRHERWQDLVSVQLNEWCSWYVLTFQSGAKIRLSTCLGGHLAVLDAIQAFKAESA